MKSSLDIRSRDGLRLEAELQGPERPRAALVLCHPHPKMGGTMEAPLLLAVTERMVEEGWAVLRFNFRGIGGSEGEAGVGIEEVADAHGALDELGSRFEVPRAIAGWSFGAAVAVRSATERDDLAACVAIAPAVKEKPDVTAGLPSPSGLDVTCPLLVVCGQNDDLVEPEDCAGWADSAGARHLELPGANHFFWAKYDDLADAIAVFLTDEVG